MNGNRGVGSSETTQKHHKKCSMTPNCLVDSESSSVKNRWKFKPLITNNQEALATRSINSNDQIIQNVESTSWIWKLVCKWLIQTGLVNKINQLTLSPPNTEFSVIHQTTLPFQTLNFPCSHSYTLQGAITHLLNESRMSRSKTQARKMQKQAISFVSICI